MRVLVLMSMKSSFLWCLRSSLGGMPTFQFFFSTWHFLISAQSNTGHGNKCATGRKIGMPDLSACTADFYLPSLLCFFFFEWVYEYMCAEEVTNDGLWSAGVCTSKNRPAQSCLRVLAARIWCSNKGTTSSLKSSLMFSLFSALYAAVSELVADNFYKYKILEDVPILWWQKIEIYVMLSVCCDPYESLTVDA